ncbi:hypothetical protein ABX050_003855 [Salmonella enterica]|uniref:Uncharacterized protein n=1 Tax=Salmonella enterica subsp. enterica serovar Abeokuta TaxID=2926665 RepID=A0A8T9IP61_SALET|nr:hypothetical protein [Salmonella enterica]ECF4097422.1 hypothetical protein [Salmonella enterica subsp. enterica serovar Adelaide]EDV2956063.1 hypothetical protein [Salmonella enterica subsp. enterica]EJN2870994.1 hypothetical protein [Salmonella enterica subsp. enterica serovar Techimani]EJN2805483.1 hypothetical protein [Salmonella enterica]EJN3654834.1 hypothetical protein [Salmonella enterica subsp. enterica serovar Techimani]
MNNVEKLIIAGVSAFGPRWQSDTAAALGVSDRTIRHWLAKKHPTPSNIPGELLEILKIRKMEIEEAIAFLSQESDPVEQTEPGVTK